MTRSAGTNQEDRIVLKQSGAPKLRRKDAIWTIPTAIVLLQTFHARIARFPRKEYKHAI